MPRSTRDIIGHSIDSYGLPEFESRYLLAASPFAAAARLRVYAGDVQQAIERIEKAHAALPPLDDERARTDPARRSIMDASRVLEERFASIMRGVVQLEEEALGLAHDDVRRAARNLLNALKHERDLRPGTAKAAAALDGTLMAGPIPRVDPDRVRHILTKAVALIENHAQPPLQGLAGHPLRELLNDLNGDDGGAT